MHIECTPLLPDEVAAAVEPSSVYELADLVSIHQRVRHAGAKYGLRKHFVVLTIAGRFAAVAADHPTVRLPRIE